MTKEERAARADLKRRVKELMRATEKMAMEKLDHLMCSGAGIVEQHTKNGGTYEAPKDFLCAFAKEMERQWGKPYIGNTPDRAWKRRVSNYYVMM